MNYFEPLIPHWREMHRKAWGGLSNPLKPMQGWDEADSIYALLKNRIERQLLSHIIEEVERVVAKEVISLRE